VRKRTIGTVLATLGVVALTGCGSTQATVPVPDNVVPSIVASESAPEVVQEIGPPPEPQVGTGGELIPIQSSNVQAAGYDADTGVMTVLFDSGGLYEYYDVPAGLWEAFVAAQPHPWSAVGDPQLVKGGYQYSRIG
jgi:hypothetical protein